MAEQLMRAQLKGSTASINSTAGYKGVLVLNTDTNHLHVLTGEAGNNIELANKTDIPETVDVSGKADISYVNAQLNTKLSKTEKAESAKVADSATKATRDASGNVITTTYATKSEVTSGLAGKQPVGDYATNTALTEGLATKLDATAKAVSAGTADSATKATQDANGNVIHTTYATKSELGSISTYASKEDIISAAETALNGANPVSAGDPNLDEIKTALAELQANVGAIEARPIPNAYIVETWKSGTSWYRVWSNGWIEQGGVVKTSGDTTSVTLHKVFTNSGYSILNTMGTPSAQEFNANIVVFENNKTASAFKLRTFFEGISIYWYACGY